MTISVKKNPCLKFLQVLIDSYNDLLIVLRYQSLYKIVFIFATVTTSGFWCSTLKILYLYLNIPVWNLVRVGNLATEDWNNNNAVFLYKVYFKISSCRIVADVWLKDSNFNLATSLYATQFPADVWLIFFYFTVFRTKVFVVTSAVFPVYVGSF